MTMISDAFGSSGDRSFWTGLRIQGNVIGALLMREIHTRYGRDNVGYLWLFLEPLSLASMVALLHVGGGSSLHIGAINPVSFAILGYTLFIMFRGMVTRAEGTLESNMPLLYHRRVTVFDMMFSRALLEGASTFVTFIILIGFAMSVGIAQFPARLDYLLIGVGLIFLFSLGVSLLICAWTHDNRLVGRFVHPITYILMPLSGAFYQISWLPEPYRTWISWFPMTIIFETARYGQFQEAKDTYINIPYVLGWCLILNYTGLVSVKAIRRHIHLN